MVCVYIYVNIMYHISSKSHHTSKSRCPRNFTIYFNQVIPINATLWNLATWHGVDNYICMHMRIIRAYIRDLLQKLCMRMCVDLGRRCPRIVAAWYSALKLNLTTATFQGNTVYMYMYLLMSSCKFLAQLQEECQMHWFDVLLHSTQRILVPYGLDISGSPYIICYVCLWLCVCVFVSACVCICTHIAMYTPLEESVYIQVSDLLW